MCPRLKKPMINTWQDWLARVCNNIRMDVNDIKHNTLMTYKIYMFIEHADDCFCRIIWYIKNHLVLSKKSKVQQILQKRQKKKKFQKMQPPTPNKQNNNYFLKLLNKGCNILYGNMVLVNLQNSQKLTVVLPTFHACHMLHASQDHLKLDMLHQVPSCIYHNQYNKFKIPRDFNCFYFYVTLEP